MTAEADALALLRCLKDASAPPEEMQRAVNDARDLDPSWQSIGDALGIARGNAYQRFRRRPPACHLAIMRSSSGEVTTLALRGERDALTAPWLVDAIAEGPTTRRPLIAMGLDQALDIYATMADAVKDLR